LRFYSSGEIARKAPLRDFPSDYGSIADAPGTQLSSVLLTRARSLANEHGRLSTELAETYDSDLAKRAGELAATAQAIKAWDDAHEVRRGSLFQCGVEDEYFIFG
jgi:hypothetical protein